MQTSIARGSTLQQRLARKMLMSVPLKGTEQILDVGCGDGKITAEIAAQVLQGSVLGVDLSRNMIDFASKNFTQPKLRFEVGDVCELPYREEFDLVVSFFTRYEHRKGRYGQFVKLSMKTVKRGFILSVTDHGRV